MIGKTKRKASNVQSSDAPEVPGVLEILLDVIQENTRAIKELTEAVEKNNQADLNGDEEFDEDE